MRKEISRDVRFFVIFAIYVRDVHITTNPHRRHPHHRYTPHTFPQGKTL